MLLRLPVRAGLREVRRRHVVADLDIFDGAVLADADAGANDLA